VTLLNGAALPLGSHPVFRAADCEETRGAGRTLAELVKLAVCEFGRADSAFGNPVARAQFEQLFMTTLLLAQAHSCSVLLERTDRQIVPRDVKRAIEYINGHLDQPITMADLVAECGVPGRTLRKHFRDFRGLSPMEYVQQKRLEQARADLLDFDGRSSIAGVANRWGFSHLGRFALAYRRQYGESPSETARRSRAS
jgi:AraC-like DNA-binding protein